jgi:Leucine-rich repeat (LRR) protein
MGDHTVSLQHRGLTCCPDAVWTKINARRLLLARNSLPSLPDQLSNLKQLRDLDISSNKLEALPASVTCLSHLTRLRATNNYITDVPPTLARLLDLQVLTRASSVWPALYLHQGTSRRCLDCDMHSRYTL